MLHCKMATWMKQLSDIKPWGRLTTGFVLAREIVTVGLRSDSSLRNSFMITQEACTVKNDVILASFSKVMQKGESV